MVKRINWGDEETFEGDGYGQYHDCGGGFLCVYIGQNLLHCIP